MKKNNVYIISLAFSITIAIVAIVFRKEFAVMTNAIFFVITENFSWFYQLVMLAFVVFVAILAFSKYGDIKLGNDGSKPEYSTFSWFAMLFCAGMGVGLVFWGISEPVSHYVNPPAGITPSTAESAGFAMKATFMHWGIHPWANYAVVGLAIAYFQFRKQKPALMRYALSGVLGEKTEGWLGKSADILAVFASVAGIVTSLGLGVLQINTGLNAILGLPNNIAVQISIIAVVTVIFTMSSISGLNKGIKVLSDINVYIAIALMIGTFLVGPKVEMLNNLTNGIGAYLGSFIEDSLAISSYSASADWIKAWRVFYWAWWIAWAPFVGLFIARISKGRTIREFVIGVVGAPTIASLVWFAIFGTMGLHLGETGMMTTEELQQVAAAPESGVFAVLQHYPMGTVLSIVALLLLLIFFITSADSGTFVLSMLSSNGDMNPPKSKKITWGMTQSMMAIGLLIGGSLKPLQTLSIVAAFPFSLIMVVMCVSLLKELKNEKI